MVPAFRQERRLSGPRLERDDGGWQHEVVGLHGAPCRLHCLEGAAFRRALRRWLPWSKTQSQLSPRP